jgi:FkbM family methyltransferase
MHVVRELLRRAGIEVIARQPRNFPRLRRPLLLGEEAITLVLDVGANAGQWGRELRRAGYGGRLVSFEPGTAAFDRLAAAAAGDTAWDCHRLALGRANGSATLHVTANSVSSSILPIGERQGRVDERAAPVADETVEVRRLESLDLAAPSDRIYLKVDAEGAELEVLEGAGTLLDQVRLLELELSAYPLRTGQPLLGEVTAWCERAGFLLVGFEVSFRDHATGDLLSGNGFFRRVTA